MGYGRWDVWLTHEMVFIASEARHRLASQSFGDCLTVRVHRRVLAAGSEPMPVDCGNDAIIPT